MNDVLIGAGVASVILARKVAFSIVVHQISHFVENEFSQIFGPSSRKKAIHEHYLARAKKEGHQTKDVTLCREELCSMLATA